MARAYEETEIAGADGEAIPAWLYRPESGKGLGICVLSDVFGLRPEFDAMIQPFAEHGYTVLAPHMFHGVEPVIETDEKGNEIRGWRGKSDDEKGLATLEAGVRALRAMPETEGRVAVTGFCFGGTLSYLAAVRRDDITAAAGYYPTAAHKYLDEGGNMHCPLIMHISATDRTHKPEDAARLRAALLDIPLALGLVYPGTVHGFSANLHPGHDAEMTRLANLRTFALFDSC